VRCLISSSYAWIRFPIESEQEKTRSDLLTEAGSDVFISSLIPSASNRSGYPLFYVGKSFSIRKTRSYPKPNKMLEEYHYLQDHELVDLLSAPRLCLRDLIYQEQAALVANIECSFNCTVISWRTISSSSKFTTIEIHGIDASYVSALIEYNIPSDILHVITKAYEKGSFLRVDYGIVTSLDPTYDVIRVMSGDRTVIAAHGQRSNSIAMIDCITAEESRMASLRNNRLKYLYACIGLNISCTRTHANAITILALRKCDDNDEIVLLKTIYRDSMSFKLIPRSLVCNEWCEKLTDQLEFEEWISINETCDLIFSSLTTLHSIEQYPVDGIIFSLKRTGFKAIAAGH
jgi:hypothetical protein